MGIYDDPFSRKQPDLRQYQTHPVIEAQLLDPGSEIWRPGSMFLRIFPEHLFPCVGARMVRAANPSVPKEERDTAKRELAQLERSIRRFFRAPTRSTGRPTKLTPIQRENMKMEYYDLMGFIGSFSKRERPTQAELSRLFRDPDFLAQLLLKSPTRRAKDPQFWSRFLRNTARLPLSERCVHYLALRYNVESSTIQHAIWPRTKPAK